MKLAIRLCALATVIIATSQASAAFHLWSIEEVYSNSDGSVQFIELEGQTDSQHLLDGHTMVADSDGSVKSMTFDSNLPSSSTNNRRMLLATPGFADQPGGIAPDYEIPPRFFDPHADTINLDFAEGSDQFQFSCTDLPTDGVESLLRNLATAVNSPVNFSGESGELEAVIVFIDRFEVVCSAE